MTPRCEHNACNEIAMQGIGTHKNGSLAAIWLEMLVMFIKLNEEGAHKVKFRGCKVADVSTSVVQDAILDHMGSDFRCQNEVMNTRNC